jgi:hypothetical protein
MKKFILASSLFFLFLGGVASSKEIKYFQCIYEDGSSDGALYAYDKRYFYIAEKITFKESQRFKIEKEMGEILFAPVFYKNDKENILFKHSEYRFNKAKESLYIQYYPQLNNNNSKKKDYHSLKCQEVRPVK